MSRVYDEILKGSVGCNVCGAPDENTWEKTLYHIRSLEEAMTILIDIVKSEKPRLDLSNFTKLLD